MRSDFLSSGTQYYYVGYCRARIPFTGFGPIENAPDRHLVEENVGPAYLKVEDVFTKAWCEFHHTSDLVKRSHLKLCLR